MNILLDDFYKKYSLNQTEIAYFDNLEIEKGIFYRDEKRLFLKIKIQKTLPFNLYKQFNDFVTENILENSGFLELEISSKETDLSALEIVDYIKNLGNKRLFNINMYPQINNNKCRILLESDNDYEIFQLELNFLKTLLEKKGINYDIEIDFVDGEFDVAKDEAVVYKVINKKEENEVKEVKKYQKYKKNTIAVKLIDLTDEMNDISVIGKVFKIDNIETKTGRFFQTLYIEDESAAIIVKNSEGSRFSKEKLLGISKGKTYKFEGSYRYDNYAKDYCLFSDKIEEQEVFDDILDDAEIKRVELDIHSNRSEMDGVCDVSEFINAAFKMGHKGIALCDHMNVQAFPKAQKTVESLLKKNPDKEFKMLYGVQLNLVNERLNIVRNSTDDNLKDLEYVIFDLETTGLSTYYDYIIEFGAVIYKNGMEIDRYDFFVKPPIEIPVHIQNITNIKNSDVEKARTFGELADDLVKIFKNRVIVAHNASFDFNFVNEEFKRIGYPKLENPVIDTLDLARSLYKNRRSYRLGNLAKLLGISYDEQVAHRADYDAEVLAKVFNKIMPELLKSNIVTLNDLANHQSEDAFVKNFANHINLIVKNKKGLKDLFKLVSISHTDQLAVFGKANSKNSDSDYMAEPRIFRKTLQMYRADLLLGSSGYNGEVFESAAYKSQDDLEEAVKMYDYIEIQPLENYRHLVESGKISNIDILKDIIKRIIKTAIKFNKIVVATTDARYVAESSKIIRDVYINTPGIGGARHPLYIYDKEKRLKQITPNQKFLNTKEMKKSFSFLEDDDLIDDIVVKNTNKILDICENVKPMHKSLFPPHIENSDKLLTDIVEANAIKLYGENRDEFIDKRIKKELDAIISNGYGVVYYVSHLLVKKSNDEGYLVGSRGSVGSSIIATLAGITEVNPLPAHYRCPNCKKVEWANSSYSGYNLKDKNCDICNEKMIGDGQDIPFETFLGFEGDKVPDIDLNFSSEYQEKAHLFTREVFGKDHVFRAGTISTVAEKTAFGYVKGYCDEMNITYMSRAMKEKLSVACEGVKRTTGQHPGGIIVIPSDKDVYDFTPVQYPANALDAEWKTTHFDFNEIHDNVLKFDILGHVDPSAMKLLENISGINPKDIPMNDEKVMSIFNSSKSLGIINNIYDEVTGACGLPEFGTRFVRGILELTKPNCFSDLVQISGLSHGTDVWNNNAKDLIEQKNIKLQEVIGCRDDIMTYLIKHNLESKNAFNIMECVRKGKGLSEEQEKEMKAHNIPDWYIESCKKIKYMFPKAHAVAYVIMAIRVAWFKVYKPVHYYISFFSLRCNAFEIETMILDAQGIKNRMEEINRKKELKDPNNPISKKEIDLYDTLEISFEMACRGYKMTNIDLNLSLSKEFRINPNNPKEIIPPFTVVDGLGEAVADSIVEARNKGEFSSKEDLMSRTQISKTLKDKLEKLGVLLNLDDSNQTTLF